jgi:hypothetical protein
MTSEKIIFYAMNGCGHCDNAKDALAEEINSGKIKLLSNFEAPYGVQGFPHFVNTVNKRTCTGWPGSKNNLLEKLDCVELFGDDDDIDDFFKVKVKEDFPKDDKENPCYQRCWDTNGGPAGIQTSITQWPTNPNFRTNFEACKDNCDIARLARLATQPVIPKATQPVTPKATQPVIPKFVNPSGQSQDCKDCAVNYKECVRKCKKEGFSENFEMGNLPPHKRFEMETFASHNVVERMDTIPTDVLYRHQAGGYLPLSNCWVKQPNYTA